MPFQKIKDLGIEYALINFDDRGRERTDDPEGGVFSRTLLEKARQEKPSHVFLFSHGWKGDMPSAVEQYSRWIGAMWKLEADRTAMGPEFRPMFIGLHWPSLPWGEESFGAGAASFGTADAPAINTLLEAAVRHFGGSDEVRRPLEVIFRAFESDPAARVLPDEVVAAYGRLAAAIGFAAGEGGDAPPDRDGAPLDPQAAIRAERMASAGEAFGIFGTIKNGVLAGLRQTSFWLMKHRARTVGEQGMHTFVSDLQRACDANVHLMGHSFGCIVVSSILGGPGGNGTLTRPVNSAVLVQGAMSLWSYAEDIPDSDQPGYFRRLIGKPAVSGPIVATQSVNDRAVGFAFPAAVGLVNEVDFAASLPKFGGIGTWGIQGTTLAESKDMLDERGDYQFKPGRIYNLNGSRFIPDHSGIDGPQVAHTLWQAVGAARGQRV
jgi:hypothetical protein